MKNPIDLTKILTQDHEQKWVALSKDYKKVVETSSNLLALRRKTTGKDVVYMKVPASGKSYAY